MPLYEYHCSKCGKNFDALQKFSDPPVKKHEGCGGKTERVLSAPSFQLKGSGWYITDYGKGGGNRPGEIRSGENKGGENKGGENAESKSEAKTESSTEKKTETKSEAKTETKSETKPKSKSKNSE